MGKIVNLVFEGGGIKGLAYVGAVRELAMTGNLKTVKHMAGASAGAITAAFLGLGYSVDEVEQRMPDDFTQFKNAIPLPLSSFWGLHNGNAFYEWFSKAVADKLNNNPKATFADLHAKVLSQSGLEADACFRDIHLMGSNLSTGHGELFSYYTTPDMPIVDAVRISMSFPVFFTAKSYRKDEHGKFVIENGALVEDKNGDMYIDGGVAQNFPITLFDTGFANPETLGFRVDEPHEIAEMRDGKLAQSKPIKHWHKFGLAIVNTAMSSQSTQGLDNFRTVYIDTGKIETLQFKLKPEEKQYLVTNGKEAAKQFFAQQALGKWVETNAVSDTLRGQKRDREHLIAKANSVYFKAGQPVLQLVFNLSAAQNIWQLEEKISKYAGWLNRHWGVLSLQHHKQVGGKTQVITVRLDTHLQQQVEKFLKKQPEKNINAQLLDTSSLVLMFERGEHVRPSWMVDPQTKPAERARLLNLVEADAIGEVMQSIQAGVPLDGRDSKGNSLLHIAAHKGSSRLVHLLLTRQVPMDIQNNFNDAPLHVAVQRDALANDPGALTVKLLCDRGANVNCQNKNGSTPLLEAAATGHVEALKELLAHGANINHQNQKGLSALMLAVSNGKTAAVQYLLQANADTTLADKDGFTAQSKAELKNNAEILALFPQLAAAPQLQMGH